MPVLRAEVQLLPRQHTHAVGGPVRAESEQAATGPHESRLPVLEFEGRTGLHQQVTSGEYAQGGERPGRVRQPERIDAQELPRRRKS